MRLLAIDTTGRSGSIALAEDGIVLVERGLPSVEGFGDLLFDEIQQMLGEQGWKLSDLDGLAGAAGPGSFTGVRVGLTAVKGLAEALGKPAYAVSNLRALAALGTAKLRAVVVDARRGEVYAALYDCRLQPVQEEQVIAINPWLHGLPGSDELEFLSTDFAPFRAFVSNTRFAKSPVQEHRLLAAAVARVAMVSTPLDAAAVDANYVRRSDAEKMWKEN